MASVAYRHRATLETSPQASLQASLQTSPQASLQASLQTSLQASLHASGYPTGTGLRWRRSQFQAQRQRAHLSGSKGI